MKFALFCCIVWIALFCYYFEEISVDGILCGNLWGEKPPMDKNEKAFQQLCKEYEKFCKSIIKKKDSKCAPAVLKAIKKWPNLIRRELSGLYLEYTEENARLAKLKKDKKGKKVKKVNAAIAALDALVSEPLANVMERYLQMYILVEQKKIKT